MKHFFRNRFEKKIKKLDLPFLKIFLSGRAYWKIYWFTEISETEFSCLGIVERLESGDFVIKDIFLPKQNVGDVSAVITTDGLAEISMEFLSKPNGKEILNSLRFVGHSHVFMDTNPSTVDEKQVELFRKPGVDFFIRGIFNKKGRMEFTIFLYKDRISIIDPEWRIYESSEEMKKKIEEEFKDKVTNISSNPFNKKKKFWN